MTSYALKLVTDSTRRRIGSDRDPFFQQISPMAWSRPGPKVVPTGTPDSSRSGPLLERFVPIGTTFDVFRVQKHEVHLFKMESRFVPIGSPDSSRSGPLLERFVPIGTTFDVFRVQKHEVHLFKMESRFVPIGSPDSSRSGPLLDPIGTGM